jgi:hypothetical protein
MHTAGARPAFWGILTPARDAFFQASMRQKKSPEAFEALAEQFDTFGLPLQAKLLRARAASRKLTNVQQDARRKVVAQVFASQDSKKMREFADICEQQGMTICAGRLRAAAQGHEDAAKATK